MPLNHPGMINQAILIFNVFFFQKGESAVNNFDPDFTMEPAKLTPVDDDLLKSMDQAQFRGFSFINPNFKGVATNS